MWCVLLNQSCELMKKELYAKMCALSDMAGNDVRAVIARECGEEVASELHPLVLDGTLSAEELLADVIRQYYAVQAGWLMSGK